MLATLDEFADGSVLKQTAALSAIFRDGLLRLKETGLIAKVRGEGMVFGIECGAAGALAPNDVANEVVKACYLGDGTSGDGIHLLGALAGRVIRVAPPMTMTDKEARASLDLMHSVLHSLSKRLAK